MGGEVVASTKASTYEKSVLSVAPGSVAVIAESLAYFAVIAEL